jgi:Holliday junction resolvasome RuvABC endonuclease subunit
MQDLGRIEIDITTSAGEPGSTSATGGGGGDEGGDGGGGRGTRSVLSRIALAMRGVAGAIAKAGMVIAVIVGVIAKVVEKVIEGLKRLYAITMEVHNALRDYSPAIQVAEMMNEIAMMQTKFRLAGTAGTGLAAMATEQGRIDRAMLELKTTVAGFGAAILTPILRLSARTLEIINAYIPRIQEMLAQLLANFGELVRNAGAMFFSAHSSVFGTGLSRMFPTIAPGLFGTGLTLEVLGNKIITMADDVRAINRNTSPTSMVDINQPFLDDLRLMGAKI